jgi:hypothetical protein
MTVKEFEKKWGVKFCADHTGKMENMVSLSTSVIENEDCRKRSKIKGSICEKCFARAMAERYGKNFKDKYAENTRILTSVIIPVNEWAEVNSLYVRLEAFGDLNNPTQFINFNNFAKHNPKTVFALWTKNPRYIKEALDMGHKKAKNLIIIYSSPMVNAKVNTEKLFKLMPFIDKVFTVFDGKTILKDNIDINCGARNCFTCGKCYSKRTTKEIREKLK